MGVAYGLKRVADLHVPEICRFVTRNVGAAMIAVAAFYLGGQMETTDPTYYSRRQVWFLPTFLLICGVAELARWGSSFYPKTAGQVETDRRFYGDAIDLQVGGFPWRVVRFVGLAVLLVAIRYWL